MRTTAFLEIGGHSSRARTYQRLGALMAEMGHKKIARLFLQRSLKIAPLAQDRFTEALAYHDLGNLARRCGDWEHAARYYAKAMEIHLAFNDVRFQIAIQLDLGRLAYRQGRWIEGQNHLFVALRQAIEIQDHPPREQALGAIGRLWRKSGDTSLPDGVAQVLGITRWQAETVLQKKLLQ